MNAHKLATRPTREYKKCVRQERRWIKLLIKHGSNSGRTSIEISVKYKENLQWLEKKRFKPELIPFTDFYRISWE